MEDKNYEEAEKYYAEHPEYFALRHGKRTKKLLRIIRRRMITC